jgi:hypothetical protein
MSHHTLTLPARIAKWPGLRRGTLLGFRLAVTDANRHRLSLLLALAGTLMMCALAMDRIYWNTAVFDMPAFKASKPPLHDLSIEPMRGPRI